MANLKSNQFVLDGHTFSEIPLLFQTEMVKAVMEDRKTQTRRIRGLKKFNQHPDDWWFRERPNDPSGMWEAMRDGLVRKQFKCPYGKPGDLLWVRENFKIIPPNQLYFQADPENKAVKGWKPSIHMPKAAARLWLMVEEIRVERLQDISEEDAIKEGISYSRGPVQNGYGLNGSTAFNSAKSAFRGLWMSINGDESWDANPWVWVVKFRVLSKTGRPSDDVIQQNWKEVRH